MPEIRFAWDESKNRLNKRKHRISFEEAKTVFYDEDAIQFSDPDHSQDEDRFLMLGLSHRLRILVVCHCFREDDSIIRIISARKAAKKEIECYEEGSHEG
ncbi:MAG: BrnT family toxin [Candidatus Omnitrophica bacterium]|nr:BrnT family toxin [Candidatus Omnitrophota bacterium]